MVEVLAGAAFQALGDANRRAIVEELRGGERSVVELTRRLQISQPAVSRHLRLLKQAGLVEDEAAGARRMYRLRADGALAVRAYIQGGWGEAAGRFGLGGRARARPGGGRGTAPWRLVFEGDAEPDPAFGVWTQRASMGWPPAPPAANRKATRLVFEPKPGGRVFERDPDGNEVDWG